MKNIKYDDYLNKVYGCFLGKCIGGTAGGPAEGRKELMDFPLNEELLHSALPNDDLDIQILWLELLQEKGVNITARDMAKEFYEKVPYSPGEYGVFKKNYAAGIYPPYSGSFNNKYYHNGMGCPIRSEIWACLFPGAPELTKKYVFMDGSLDHTLDSIEAEYFLASIESEAFLTDDFSSIQVLLENSLARITKGTKLYGVICDTLKWYNENLPWKYTRGLILRNYGHSDCTNLYQNIGFTILSLLYGEGDFRETIRIGLACGYDTDCICATAASILGIILGAEHIIKKDNLTDTGINVGINTRLQHCSIKEFAISCAHAGVSMERYFEDCIHITDYPQDYKALPLSSQSPPYSISAEYTNAPILCPGKDTNVDLVIKKFSGSKKSKISIKAPIGISVEPSEFEALLSDEEAFRISLKINVTDDCEILYKQNLFEVSVDGFTDNFGLMGATLWKRFGPFLMNNKDLSNFAPEIAYRNEIKIEENEVKYDVIRDFHLNNFADINKEYVNECEPFINIEFNGYAETIPQKVYTTEDLFKLSEIQHFEGPHTDYLIATFVFENDGPMEFAIGQTAPFKLWVNGKYIGGSDSSSWWTAENKHFNVNVLRGENTIVLKCAQVSSDAEYSVIPRIVNSGMSHLENFGVKL